MPTAEPDAAPDELGTHAGLAYVRFLAADQAVGGMLVLHGAGSRKENHFDFALAARDAGFEAVVFDARGHGASTGLLDGRAIEDVVAVASLLPRPLVLRGSSMGGYFALTAAVPAGAAAVVAICPASGGGLSAGLRSPERAYAADVEALDVLLAAHDVVEAVRALTAPLLIQHAEGDEVVPLAHSLLLLEAAGSAGKRLTVVPGGDHRSVQHDPEMQAQGLAFAREAVA